MSRCKDNTSVHLGVYWDKGADKWKAYIRIDGKLKHLGFYNILEDALEARQQAEGEVMKTTEEMIAVMQAHKDGEVVQRRAKGAEHWIRVYGIPAWDWGYSDYRVKPAEPKKVMMQMWRDDLDGYESAHPEGALLDYQTKIGEPFEFVFPEEEG